MSAAVASSLHISVMQGRATTPLATSARHNPHSGLTDGCQSYAIVNIDRSTDGGSSFSHVFQIGIGGHFPPSLETDSAGDVLVVVNDAGSTDGAWVYKLPARNWNRPELMGTLTYGYDDKFTTAYDADGQSASSGGTYWEMHGGDGPTNNHYVMVATRAAAAGWGGGRVNTRCTFGSQQNCYFWLADADSGPLAPPGGVFAHYPHIYFDRSGSCPTGQTGRCDLAMIAWTTTDQSCSAYGYYDIHYLISPDGGATWYGRDGAIPYANFPILAGDDGPGWQLLDSAEYNSGRNTCTNDANWLASIYIQDGHLFFIYRHQRSHALYRRVTPTWTGSGYTMANDVGPTPWGWAMVTRGPSFPVTAPPVSHILNRRLSQRARHHHRFYRQRRTDLAHLRNRSNDIDIRLCDLRRARARPWRHHPRSLHESDRQQWQRARMCTSSQSVGVSDAPGCSVATPRFDLGRGPYSPDNWPLG